MKSAQNDLPIGIFDSGVGGISVLGRVVRALPKENFIYYADTVRFPYGDRTTEEVREGVFEAATAMAEKGIKMLVVACNTATAAAIKDLRAKYVFPVLGIEPALKPAVEKVAAGKVAVIATELTLREQKFRDLFQRYGEKGDIVNLPAPGLADLVEQGHYHDDAGRAYIKNLFQDIQADTVVLGCTHYLFLLPLIKELLPQADIIDGGEGLTRNIVRILKAEELENTAGEGNIEVMSSAPEKFIPRFDEFFRNLQSILDMLRIE